MATQHVTASSLQRVAMAIEDPDAYGDAVQPLYLLEEYDNTLDFNQGVVEQRVHAGTGQRIHVARGFGQPEGSLPVLITPDKSGAMLYALLGAVTPSGAAAPYTHTIVPSTDGSRPSMTFEHRYGNLWRIFSGMTISQADFTANNGDMLRATFQVSGKESLEYDTTQSDAAVAWDALNVITSPMMTISRDDVEVTDTYNPSWTITNELVFAAPQQAGVYTPRTGAGAGGVSATISFFVHSESDDPEGPLLRSFYGDSGSAYPFGPASGEIPHMSIKFEFESNEEVGTSGTNYGLTFEFPYARVLSCARGEFGGMNGWNIQMVADIDPSTGYPVEITVVNAMADLTVEGSAIT